MCEGGIPWERSLGLAYESAGEMLLGSMLCGWRVRTRPAALTVVWACGDGACVVDASCGVLLLDEEDVVVAEAVAVAAAEEMPGEARLVPLVAAAVG